jgi:hypothetical protein
MKIKKNYEEPTMQVVMLQQRSNILIGSDMDALGEDFGWDDVLETGTGPDQGIQIEIEPGLEPGL